MYGLAETCPGGPLFGHENAQSKSGRSMKRKTYGELDKNWTVQNLDFKYFQPVDERFRMELDSFKQIGGSNVDDNVMWMILWCWCLFQLN